MISRQQAREGAVPCDGLTRQGAAGHSIRRVRASVIVLGLVSAVLMTERGSAQNSELYRLTVRPREMATGTRTQAPGFQHLKDSLTDVIYVPQQCVGTRRCPLLTLLNMDNEWFYNAADRYGIILQQHSREGNSGELLDAALKQILRDYAIDPNKLAILGRCAGVRSALNRATKNLDVFSRILLIAGPAPVFIDSLSPPNKTTEFFVEQGIRENNMAVEHDSTLRQAGYPVKFVFALNTHDHQLEAYDFIGRWLHESWATPKAADRPAPAVVAEVPLTTDALARMTQFWTKFHDLVNRGSLRDNLFTNSRRDHLREMAVPAGKRRLSVQMVDMTAMAARYPDIASYLQESGLTPEEHDTYRVALVSAEIARTQSSIAQTIEPTSVQAKNIAFLEAHPDELQELEETGFWITP